MINKRVAAMALVFAMLFQSFAPTLAETVSASQPHQELQKHTITITPGDRTGALLPLASETTLMADMGSFLQNAQGVVETQVQSVYQANQTLVSVSLADTSFAFAPLMLDNYYPLAEPSVSPEVSASPEPSVSPELSASPDRSILPEASISPNPSLPLDAAASTDPNQSTEATVSPDAQNNADAANHSEASPSISPEASETPVPSGGEETSPAATKETPLPSETPQVAGNVEPEPAQLLKGYGQSTRRDKIYKSLIGQETLGILGNGIVLYVIDVPNTKRAHVVLDTTLGLVEGFMAINSLRNLDVQEEERAKATAKRQEKTELYDGNPLPRTDGYMPDVIPQTETPAPIETPATVPPSSTPIVTAAPTAQPTEKPTGTISPTEQPTAQPTEQLTVQPTTQPTPDPTEQPTEKPADTPTPQPVEEVTTPPETEPPTPEAPPEGSGKLIQRPSDWFAWLIPSALAEASHGKPSSIAGHKHYVSRARSFTASTGSVSGITYPGLFDAETDVRLSVTTTGVKEDIVVNRYTGNHIYAYRLTTEGLSASQSGQEVHLYRNGQLLAKLEAPHMTDANGVYSTDISVALEGAGGSYVVTYKPNDAWMQAAAYPVTIDPSGSYFNDLATNIGDAYVTANNPNHHYDHTVPSGSAQQNHNLEGTNLYAGTYDGGAYAYVIPSLTGFSYPGATPFPNGGDILIDSAQWNINVHNMGGDGRFRISLVTGGWNTAAITYNNSPGLSQEIYVDVNLHTGWNSIDVTKLFSAWFNASDQKQNYGIAVSSSSSWARICASDIWPRSERMNFQATYYTGISAPALSANAQGYGVNSQSGWVDLSWNAVPSASGYVLGIYNGQTYEYRFVGSVTNYSTKGKKLWPTDAEIAAGSYALHWNGSGQELPNIPRKGTSDLNYYFRVLPANQYGQTVGSHTAGQASVVLPDTTPPNQAATLSISPASWSNAETRMLTWAGILDMPSGSASLGSGHVQYVVNPTGNDQTAWAWQNTSSNAANGSFDLSITDLQDGTHAVYVRGMDGFGNYGTAKGAQLYVDKTPPTAPTVSVLPDDWTKENDGSLTWTGIADVNALLRVEYAIGTEPYVSAGLADKSYAAFALDLSALMDGEHTLSVRGVDVAGNTGAVGTARLKIDRGAPVLTTSAIDPAAWADTQSVNLTWTGLKDPFSGLKELAYQINSNAWIPITVSEDGSETIDISSLADGEHTITLKATDRLDNSATFAHTLYLDRTPPETSLASPQDGAVVTGVLDIWGGIKDISLLDWTLAATGSSGKVLSIVSGDTQKDAEQLGIMDTAEFSDGETIEIVLTAHDKAGHESIARGVFIKADHSTKPIVSDVTVTAPQQGEVVTTAHKVAAYTPNYTAQETENKVILDGLPAGAAVSQQFPLYPILYPEDSLHSLSVISKADNDTLHYSQGMATVLVISDILKDATKLSDHSGLNLSVFGAEATQATGSLTSQTFTAPRPMLAIRLHTIAQLAPGGSVSCEYSMDGGASWHAIDDTHDAWFETPQSKVAVRATLTGIGTRLQGLDITGVYEMNPIRWKVKLLRSVTSFDLIGSSDFTVAMPDIAHNSPATLSTRHLYIDGQLSSSDSFKANLLPFEDGTGHAVALVGLDDSGNLHGSGAASSILLRGAPEATGVYESGKLTLTGDTCAIRLETLCVDAASKPVTTGAYAYSFDGSTWTDMGLNSYVLLPHAAQALYLRAMMPSGITLRALHLEGVTLTSKPISTTLIKAPYNVQAADYGDYYENEKLRRYLITWSNPNQDDVTATNTLVFDIYRNGVRIATTQNTRYEDFEYVKDAVYYVAARRVYDANEVGASALLTRASRRVKASYVYIPKEQRVETVTHNVQNFTQSEYLNDLYGGNYTFSTTPNPPSHDFALNQALLGPHRFCSLGFEPLNFNTGNFFLQAQDIRISDLGESALSIVRTYNSQSAETDGPFGARWATGYAQHLRLFSEGSVGYRRADGSEVLFYHQADGTYLSNTTEYEQLSYNDAQTEYHISLTNGTVYVFASGGLLSRVEENHGQHITQIVRDEDGLITKVIAPSQEEMLVEMDAGGHMTKITAPGGASVSYQYKGSNLIAVTDTNGAATKYQYDGQGRMTAWWDGNGTKQVQNTYDKQSRVVAQTDANGGRYKLVYQDDHTITTDAEGNTVTYYFDELKRTTRIVDALGGETRYTYGAQGEIVSKTDPLGGITTYEYNENGDKTKEVDPRGAAVVMAYDDQHKLLSLTDQNGNTSTYTYDAKGNLLTETAPDGGVTTYAYDEKGRRIAKTDALGNKTAYAYLNGLLVSTTDPAGGVTQYTHDANGYMASMTDALGYTTHYEHDAKGNLLKLTFADGTSVAYTYDALGRQTSMTDPLGRVTQYAYDGLGLMTKTTLPDKSVQSKTYTKNGQLKTESNALNEKITYTYDQGGNRLSVIDADGNRTLSVYDATGRLVKETNALGGETTYTYDAVGLPLSVTDPAGNTQTMAYDGAGNLLTRALPNGAVISVAYDGLNRPVKQTNALGGETLITYDLLGRILSVTDPMGAKTSYSYDANGNLLTATDALGSTTSYTYDALNRMVTKTAANGGITSYAYDSVGNLISTTDALGNKTVYAYDANGNLSAVTDALGQTAALAYDVNGRATAATQKNGGVLATAYDKAGRILTETDANGHSTKYQYTKNGLVSRVTDALGQQAQFSYDALGNIFKITAPGNSITLYAYDSAGRALSMTDPLGSVTEYTYNIFGQIEGQTVNGNASRYAYDAAGNMAAVTDAEGRRVSFTYDLAGRMIETIYPDGSKDTTEYDLLGRVQRSTPRTGLATAYAYDALGNLLSLTRGEQVTCYEYDLLGRRTKQITADGAETTYAYDALGNLLGQADPLGNTTQFAYTAESLLEKVAYANGANQSLAYDLAGNVIGETDAEGHTKQYQYDKVNRLIAVLDQLGNKTGYTYDALDNIAKVTDALKHVTSYTYDRNGNLLSEKDALGNTVKYTYTLEGWLHSITKADGTVLTFDYDKTGSLLTQNVGEGQTIQSSYNEIGKLTQISSKEGTIAYQYDDRGYLVSVTNVNGDVVSYTYDAYGNKTSMTYPDGRKVGYTYDAMNRMATVTGLDGEVTTYAYDVAGRRTETRTGGNASANPTNSASALTTTYRYDSVGNLLEQATSGVSGIAFSYSYNKNGYITGEKRTEDGKTTSSAYTYDPLGQLTSFLKNTGYSEQYTYDKAGNMLQKLITGESGNTTGSNSNVPANPAIVTLKMAYNKGNQLIFMANGQGKIAYAYDKNGSMIKKVLTSKQYGKLTDTYAYNVLDQLTSYTGYDGYQQQLTYDANGMRLSKSETGNSSRSMLEELLRGNIPGLPEIVQPTSSQTSKDASQVPTELEWATTEYLYDITQEYYQVIQETTKGKNGSTTTAYAYGLERIAAYGTDANSKHSKTSYIYDGRGSVAQSISLPVHGENANSVLARASAQFDVQSFSYTAFGEQMGAKKVTGWGYNAEAFDAATGMINLRARQYEPALNRFSRKDLLRGQKTIPESLQRYLYVYNHVVMLEDANGLRSVDNEVSLFQTNNRTNHLINNAVSQIVKTVTSTVASVKNAINNLTAAAYSGYHKSALSYNPVVRLAHKRATDQIAAIEKTKGAKIDISEKDAIFAKSCLGLSIEIGMSYGNNASTSLSKKTTDDISESYAAAYRDFSKRTDGDYCVKYALAPYLAEKGKGTLHSFLYQLNDSWKKYGGKYSPLIATSPAYAALVGTTPRTMAKDGEERQTVMQTNISLAVSVGNEDEALKLKLPGEDEFIILYDTRKLSFSTLEQKEIVDSTLGDQWSLVFKNKKIDDSPIDSTQYHVDVYEGDGLFSGVNTNKRHEDFSEYNLNNVTGLDYVYFNMLNKSK